MSQHVDPNSPAVAAAIEASDKFDGSIAETDGADAARRQCMAGAIQAYLNYREPTAFKRKDKVRHTIFGVGEVVECGEGAIRIRFEDHGLRELLLAFAGAKLTRL